MLSPCLCGLWLSTILLGHETSIPSVVLDINWWWSCHKELVYGVCAHSDCVYGFRRKGQEMTVSKFLWLQIDFSVGVVMDCGNQLWGTLWETSHQAPNSFWAKVHFYYILYIIPVSLLEPSLFKKHYYQVLIQLSSFLVSAKGSFTSPLWHYACLGFPI